LIKKKKKKILVWGRKSGEEMRGCGGGRGGGGGGGGGCARWNVVEYCSQNGWLWAEHQTCNLPNRELSAVLSLEAFAATELNEIFCGKQLRQGVKILQRFRYCKWGQSQSLIRRRAFTPRRGCLPEKILLTVLIIQR